MDRSIHDLISECYILFGGENLWKINYKASCNLSLLWAKHWLDTLTPHTQAGLTEASDGARVLGGPELQRRALRLTLLPVEEPEALHAGRVPGAQLPARHDGGAVQRLQMQLRGQRDCGERERGARSLYCLSS